MDAQEIRSLADRWYAALDRHAPLSEVLEFLLDEGLEMQFPEGPVYGREGFAEWYKKVTSRFFDEEHVISKVEPEITGEVAQVSVLVNWQARIWDPPAPRSQWLGFDADQTWIVVPDPRDERILRIKTYAVNSLKPMPGSAPL